MRLPLGPEEIPIIGALLQFGERDMGYNVLILCGPLVIALLALLGRSLETELLAGGYVTAFVLYTLYKSVE